MNTVINLEDFAKVADVIDKNKYLYPFPQNVHRGISKKTGEWVTGALFIKIPEISAYIVPLIVLKGISFLSTEEDKDYFGDIWAEEVDPKTIGKAVNPLWEDLDENEVDDLEEMIFENDIIVYKSGSRLYQGIILEGYYDIGPVQNYGWYIEVFAECQNGKASRIEPFDASLVHVINNHEHIFTTGGSMPNEEEMLNGFRVLKTVLKI